MKFSLAWLKEWLDISVSAEQIGIDLTSLGLEVESIEHTQIFDLSITPNRGDCLSMLGIARELAVKYQQNIKAEKLENLADLKVKQINTKLDTLVNIKIQDLAKCPSYYGRVICNINRQAKTPAWMVQVLSDCGVASIHPVVDVTNYVMLELGQPMHAFDLAKIADNTILIRNSKLGEKILLLDQTELELKAEILMIANSSKSLAIAGIMGGLDSAISSASCDIFLECAYFAPIPVRLTARDYALQTDASYRFERGIDPNMQEYAIERASQLLLEIVGGEMSSLLLPSNINKPIKPFVPPPIKLCSSSIERLLGIKIADKLVEDILVRLHMQLESNQVGWLVIPPAFRHDLAIEEDLIEEIARVYGYDNIPNILPSVTLNFKPHLEKVVKIEKVRTCLQARAYSEAITYSFIDETSAQIFSSQGELLKLSNPISEELACMRPSLWPGLIKALAYNQNRQAAKIRLFEIGTKFIGIQEEQQVLAGICYGHFSDCKWAEANRKIDFYDVKGDVECLLSLARHNNYSFKAMASNPVLHPSQACSIISETEEELGVMGMLHPRLEKELDVKGPIFLFEMNLQQLCNGSMPLFKKISKFPAVHRDLALVVDHKFTSGQLLDKLKLHFGDLLVSVEIFDIYTGEKVPQGKKSMALRLALQNQYKTMVDEEVNLQLNSLLSILKDQDDISLRT